MRYICVIVVFALAVSLCESQTDCRVVASCTRGKRNFPAMRRLPFVPVATMTDSSPPVDLPAMMFTKDASATQNCKAPGWIIGLNGYQYKIVTSLATWQEANELCKTVGGSLPIRAFDNADSTEFLVAIMQGYGDKPGFWLPISDRVTESKWLWNDGTPVNSANPNWAQNQPDNSGDCGWISRNMGYKWDDGTCTATFAALCERKI